MSSSDPFPEDNSDQPSSSSPTPASAPVNDYKVGYGRPPLHTRFQKGSRGNGKGGRRKRATTIEDALAAELAKVIEVRVSGKAKKMTVAEAIVQAAARRAITSDRGTFSFLKAISSRQMRNPVDLEDLTPDMSPEEAQRLIAEYYERTQRGER